jgi:hypothetical protein
MTGASMRSLRPRRAASRGPSSSAARPLLAAALGALLPAAAAAQRPAPFPPARGAMVGAPAPERARREAAARDSTARAAGRDLAPPGVLDTAALAALSWREIGPYRGGRSVAVAGSRARPNEYWMGTTGGGVFKSTDGGMNWQPVTDKYFGGTVGYIAVPSRTRTWCTWAPASTRSAATSATGRASARAPTPGRRGRSSA